MQYTESGLVEYWNNWWTGPVPFDTKAHSAAVGSVQLLAVPLLPHPWWHVPSCVPRQHQRQWRPCCWRSRPLASTLVQLLLSCSGLDSQQCWLGELQIKYKLSVLKLYLLLEDKKTNFCQHVQGKENYLPYNLWRQEFYQQVMWKLAWRVLHPQTLVSFPLLLHLIVCPFVSHSN